MIGPFVSGNQFDTEWRKRKYGEEGKKTHTKSSAKCDCLDICWFVVLLEFQKEIHKNTEHKIFELSAKYCAEKFD